VLILKRQGYLSKNSFDDPVQKKLTLPMIRSEKKQWIKGGDIKKKTDFVV